jgi:hypothetical protein
LKYYKFAFQIRRSQKAVIQGTGSLYYMLIRR